MDRHLQFTLVFPHVVEGHDIGVLDKFHNDDLSFNPIGGFVGFVGVCGDGTFWDNFYSGKSTCDNVFCQPDSARGSSAEGAA